MDPNANVQEQYTITAALVRGTATQEDVDRLDELRVTLRDWVAVGGFKPTMPQPVDVPSLVPGATPMLDDDGVIVRMARCGVCGRWWNDALVSPWTPAPSGRCPFEYEHDDEEDDVDDVDDLADVDESDVVQIARPTASRAAMYCRELADEMVGRSPSDANGARADRIRAVALELERAARS